MSKDKSKEKTSEDEKNTQVGVITGLLDFCSDRAEAHASFLVACVFGLFALLAIAQNGKDAVFALILVIPNVGLVLVGYHCLARFRFYANMAEQMRRQLKKYAKIKSFDVWLQEEREEKKMGLKQFENFLQKKYRGILFGFKKRAFTRYIKIATVVIFVLPLLVVYLPHLLDLCCKLLN